MVQDIKISQKERKEIIPRISLLDSLLNQSNNFNFQDPITIRVYYNAKKEVLSPIFQIFIVRNDGIIISTIDTQSSNFKIESIKGDGFIDFQIDAIPLFSGTYKINVALFLGDFVNQVVLLENMAQFNVFSSFEETKEGIFEIKGHWKI